MPTFIGTGQGSTTAPADVDIAAGIGASTAYARADHIHTVAPTLFQSGSGTTAAGGSLAVAFGTAFGATPRIVCSAKTAGWIITPTAANANGFTAVARNTNAMPVSGTTDAGGGHTHTLGAAAWDNTAFNGISVRLSDNVLYNQTASGGALTGVTGIDAAAAHTHTLTGLTTDSQVGAIAFDWIAIGV